MTAFRPETAFAVALLIERFSNAWRTCQLSRRGHVTLNKLITNGYASTSIPQAFEKNTVRNRDVRITRDECEEF
jgi:hypothetical protein